MKDLGVIIDDNLNFKEHIYDKIKLANQILGIIKRNFKDLSRDSFILIYKSIVRSQLEYAVQIWNPYKLSLIEDLEKVQKRATKLVKGLHKVSYTTRLKLLNLPTLRYRRNRGDMIEVFKSLTGEYDVNIVPSMPLSTNSITRGNDLKLSKERCRYDLRKHFFIPRIINLWNSLPNSIINAESVNSFKNRLDFYWRNEEQIFNYEAILTGSL